MSRPRHTGSLRLRGRVWFIRFRHHGKLVEVSTHQTDEEKARHVLREKLPTAGSAAFVAPAADRLRFEMLCDLLRRDHRRKGNRSGIEYKLAHLAAVFGGQRAMEITTDAVEQYAEEREAAGAARATVNRELAALRRMFRLALKKKLLPSMPMISTPKEDNVREGFLDPPEFARFLIALREADADVADLTEFAFRTALRRGNVVGAIWPWFTLEVTRGQVVDGRMRVPGTATKNKKPLNLPLTGAVLAVIARRGQLRREDWPYVFHRGGTPLTRFEEPWRTAAQAIGQPALLFHDLRRSAARALRRAGVDEGTIMRLGGWKTRAMFDRYAIVDEADVVEAQATLDRVLARSAAPTVVPLRRRRGR